MKKAIKKLTAMVMAAVMMMAIGATAFAANPDGTHKTGMYQDGKFDPDSPDSKLSVLHGIIQDATIVDNGDSTYTVTVGLQEDFEAYLLIVNMTKVSVNGDDATMIDADGSGKYDAFSFVYTGELTYPLQVDMNYTIDAGILPMGQPADLVIFE